MQELGGTDFSNMMHRSSIASSTSERSIRPQLESADQRSGQQYESISTYSATANGSGIPSMAPTFQVGGFDFHGRHSVATTSAKRHAEDSLEQTDERDMDGSSLFGTLPHGKRCKFILVDDAQRGCRVRVKVMLDKVDTDEIPDSYRYSNSVYPRAYFPVQMTSPPGRVVRGQRYENSDMNAEEDESATVGRTVVPVSTLDGEVNLPVPQVARKRHHKDKLLNELGYRMSWSQSRVFSGRRQFLQRSRAYICPFWTSWIAMRQKQKKLTMSSDS